MFLVQESLAGGELFSGSCPKAILNSFTNLACCDITHVHLPNSGRNKVSSAMTPTSIDLNYETLRILKVCSPVVAPRRALL